MTLFSSTQSPFMIFSVFLHVNINKLLHLIKTLHFAVNKYKFVYYSNPGPDLLSVGPCSEKNVGPFNWGGRPYFSWKKLATFFSHHRPWVSHHLSKTGDLFLLIILVSLGDRPFFRHTKICRSFCGAPFCGGPCSAKHKHAEHA